MINFPTNYDSFFKNLKIIQELTKFQKIIKYFKNRKIPFNDSYVGFVYFAELLIIHLLLNIETLIQDEYLLERIRWGEVTLEDQDMQKTLKDHPEGKYILELNSIRRDLSKIRNSDEINEDLLEKKLVELNEKLSEIDHHIKEKYSVKKIVDDPEIEQKLVIENILLNYNYMRYDVSMFSKTNNNTPRYPGNLIFYLMPGEQKSNYYLTNPRIKSRNDDYLKGYITSLEFLYITFMPERSDYFRKIFSRIKNWLDLHQTFRKMYQDLDLENLTNKQQFEYNFEPIITTIEKKRIDDYSELRKVLRDRRTRLFDNFALDEGLLAHYFYGASH